MDQASNQGGIALDPTEVIEEMALDYGRLWVQSVQLRIALRKQAAQARPNVSTPDVSSQARGEGQ